jgi:HK97 family phage portal protein
LKGGEKVGFWSNLFKRETETRNENGTLNDLLLQASVSGRVSKEQALNIPALAAGIDIISDTVASLPIKLYREENEQVQEADDDRVFLLNDETGDTLDGFQFKKALVMDFLLEGNGYAYINRQRNKVKSLHYVDATQVSILMNTDPIFKSYDVLVNGRLYRDWEFIKIARKTKNGAIGKGIINEHNEVLSIAFYTLFFEKTLVRKGGTKKGFLKAQNRLEKDAIESIKNAWKKLYSNDSENIIVLNNGLEFQEASATSVEMQLNERKITNANEINTILRMPSGKIDENAIENCISPILTAIETALNKDLLLPSEKEKSFYFAFDRKELLKGDIEKRFRAYEIAIKNGFMQWDEVRYKEDLPPYNIDFIKLGLQDVLYNPKTGEIYTPNTNKVASMDDLKTTLKGGDTNENRDPWESSNS